MPFASKRTDREVKEDKLNHIMSAVNIWASFYRANPHRFAKDYLGLALKRFQQIILCMMFEFTNLIYLASRGGGKSFMLAVFVVATASCTRERRFVSRQKHAVSQPKYLKRYVIS